MKNGSKGITLIALVITILIIFILSGIALNLFTSDNGVIINAEKARNDLEES